MGPGESRGFLVVLSAPSGAGKNTVLARVLPRLEHLTYSVSCTTRPARPGERDGVDYYFLSDEEFDRRVSTGDFLEWAWFCGHRYGTPRAFVEERTARGETVIMDIDVQGSAQVKRNWPGAVLVFLLPPSLEELRRRLTRRGSDGAAAVEGRLRAAREELRAVAEYDYVIINDELDRAARLLEAIIRAERLKTARSPWPTWLEALRKGDRIDAGTAEPGRDQG
ncbi:guanylate kinase [Limnochorda pilosa]|uniref:Guanylate kinase n=1 Tax=Limnochorda pilosa TaxID=1555112 RepID=A0A0K2SJY6_LIMPI|nr:guanylate kinase [Limnochorda pilosa]BAS27433.1 guanylate kinase [Limnochorda pilosa]